MKSKWKILFEILGLVVLATIGVVIVFGGLWPQLSHIPFQVIEIIWIVLRRAVDWVRSNPWTVLKTFGAICAGVYMITSFVDSMADFFHLMRDGVSPHPNGESGWLGKHAAERAEEEKGRKGDFWQPLD